MDTSRLRKRTSSPGGRSPRRLSTGGMPESPRAFARPSMQNKPNSQDRRRRWITQNKPNSHPACCAKQSQLPVEDKAETASPRTRQPIVRNKANFRGRGLHDNLWRAGTLALPRKTKPISRACRPGLRAGCVKQSQFAGGRMNANCRSKKGLRAKCTDHVSAKTKPICGPVGRDREPVMRNKANLRGLLVSGLACKTKPISLAGRMVWCARHTLQSCRPAQGGNMPGAERCRIIHNQ